MPEKMEPSALIAELLSIAAATGIIRHLVLVNEKILVGLLFPCELRGT